MKRTFTTSIMQEGDWYVAQCLEVDVARQGETEEEALINLGEALALHFTPPVATALPDLRPVEVEIGAAQAAALPRSQQSRYVRHADNCVIANEATSPQSLGRRSSQKPPHER